MALELDTRQRAMLLEMGVRVWLPQDEVALQSAVDSEPLVPQAKAPPLPAATKLEVSTLPARPVSAPTATPTPTSRPPNPTAPSGSALDLSALDWPALINAASSCQACGLCAGRTHSTLQASAQAVLMQADWMVLGDPPDEDEDFAGQPFVEGAGLLLDNMLKAAGLSRSGSGAQGAHAAYVSNVVKCRPPHGRMVQAQELAQCRAYLEREIALVQPKIILAMGRFAIQTLLPPEALSQPLGKQRGTVYHFQGIPVIPSYHPKFLMRSTAEKTKAWADLCLALDVVEGVQAG